MKSQEFLREYYDESEDNYSFVNIDHVRRPRITLKHLQKLRKTRSIEDIEQRQRLKDVSRIYGRGEE